MAAFIDALGRAEVYSIGVGKANGCSILEALKRLESFKGRPQVFTAVPENRVGDRICYYSDLRKMQAYYPEWQLRYSLRVTIQQIVDAWKTRNIEN
jgi:CDP-paratose 2-epimerase